MARVICPFCFKPHDFASSSSLKCPERDREIPGMYLRDYDKVPPLWLVTVGFSTHGKTCYLAALTLMLENISAVWPDAKVYYQPLDQYTQDAIRLMRAEAKEGKKPDKTKTEVPDRPLLFSIYNLPEVGSRCLVMYDVRGEIYDSFESVQRYVAPIKEVNTIWFLISLDDLMNDANGKTVTDLFNVYWTAMQNLRVDLKERNLVVIYTKGDKAVFSPEIKQYLLADPLKGLTLQDFESSGTDSFSFPDYLKQMQSASAQIENFTRRHVPRGAAFINMIRDRGMNLIFTVTSALGQDSGAASNKLVENALRYRVLDPFFWAITLDRPPEPQPITLLVDTSAQEPSPFENGLLSTISDRLSSYGHLTIFYLGQMSPISLPGQPIPSAPPRLARYNLIGPLLERMSPDTYAIAFTASSVADLEDFYQTSWQNHLLLVITTEDLEHSWPHQTVYHPGDDPVSWIEQLKNAQP
ncbi:hypothetical protein TFLX_03974 [Thermoflexales bacterium]|nr:hypothetical protein TFLX_03974 [Thermoflexales bacterium]